MFSQLAAPPSVRKFVPPKMAKNTNTRTRPMSEPDSGRRMRLPIEGRVMGGGAALAGWICVWDAMGVSILLS